MDDAGTLSGSASPPRGAAQLWIIDIYGFFVAGFLVTMGIQHFRWGSVFLLGVPVMALLLITGPVLLPESRAPSARRVDLGSAALSLAGAAAALSETGSELGGALGIALLGSIASATYRGDLGQVGLPEVPPEVRRAALDTLGTAAGAASRLSPDHGGAVLLAAANTAFTHGMQATLTICAVVCVALSVVAAVALRRSARLARCR